MRSAVKGLAEQLLLYTGPASLSGWLHRGRALVLAYHNIVPDGETVEGDASLHLSQQAFARQLDLLVQADIRVVSLDELMDIALGTDEPSSVRHVAITFDDGYRGAIHAGVEELTRRGLPATFFVVPGLVGDQTFWWDALSAPESGLDREARRLALVEADGRNDEVIAWARRQGMPIRSIPAHARSASETELRGAVANDGIRLASHTWSHPNLANLDEASCLSEIRLAADWLRNRFGRNPRWLSYPYGLSSRVAERTVSAANYSAAFGIRGGWLSESPERNRFRLPRLDVSAGVSTAGFRLRLAGLLTG